MIAPDLLRGAARWATFGLVVTLVACSRRVDPPVPDEATLGRLGTWMADSSETPADLVLDLFTENEVVLVGESHYIHHDPALVKSLLEPIHRGGVHVLGLEFARREDQARIDSLLAAPEWDETAARALLFDQYVHWGFQEYVDILHEAWRLNRNPDLPPFHILGLNDSPDWSQLTSQDDRNNPEVMGRVWRGGGEDRWSAAILDAVNRGEKVLTYSGIHHAFSRFEQPIVQDGRFVRFDATRMGNHLRRALGDRVATVFLHAPWSGPKGYDDTPVHPAGGAIDALMLARPDLPRPRGFRVRGTPFGELPLGDAVYAHGHDDPRLGDFCDAWIYTCPISEYEGVTPIPGWIHAGNLDRARAGTPDLRMRDATADRFNRALARVADVGRKWGHLR